MRAITFTQGVLLLFLVSTAFAQLPNIPIGTRVLINDRETGRLPNGEITSGSGSISGDITNPSGLGCSDGAIDLTISGGTGPYDVTWYDRDGEIGSVSGVSGDDDSEDIDDLAAGFYQVLVEDALCGQATAQFGLLNGVSKVSLVEIQNVQSCEVRPDGTVLSTCDGAMSVSVDVDVPYEIEWFGPNNFYTKGTESVTGLCAGEYTVKIEIEGGCIFYENFSLCCCEQFTPEGGGPKSNTLPESCTSEGYTFPLTIYTDIYESPSTGTSSDGRLRINFSGGNGDVAIAWSGPNGFTSNDFDISGLGVGTYCVILQDGCSTTQQCFELVDCSAANLNVGASIRPTCEGYALGRIDLNVSGDNPPFRYRWDDNSRENYRDFLDAGVYCVTVSDSKGCSERNVCFTVGFTDFRFIEQSRPCGTGVYCTDFRVDFIPFEGDLDCRFDDPSSCRTLNCYCPLNDELEGPPRTIPYVDTEIDFANCRLIGFCPEGGTEVAESGTTVSVSTLSQFPGCSAYASICCVRLDFCSVGGRTFLQDVIPGGAPLYRTDPRCDSRCSASCGNETTCLPSFAFEPPPCTGGVAPPDGGDSSWPEANVADALLRLYYQGGKEQSTPTVWMPRGTGFRTTLSEYRELITNSVEQRLKADQLVMPTEETLKALANFQYQMGMGGELFVQPKEDIPSNAEADPAGLRVHPNPSSGEFILSSTWNKAHRLELSVINTLGEIIWTTAMDLTGDGDIRINLSDLPAGVYYVRVSQLPGYDEFIRIIKE